MKRFLDKIPAPLSSLWLLLVLNLIDAISTHLALTAGIAYEVNPLMAWAWATAPAVFWGIKIGLVTLGALVLRRIPGGTRHPVLLVSNLIYCAILSVHVAVWVAGMRYVTL